MFIDHSPPSADTAAAGLLLCWRGHRISTVSVGHVFPGGGIVLRHRRSRPFSRPREIANGVSLPSPDLLFHFISTACVIGRVYMLLRAHLLSFSLSSHSLPLFIPPHPLTSVPRG